MFAADLSKGFLYRLFRLLGETKFDNHGFFYLSAGIKSMAKLKNVSLTLT